MEASQYDVGDVVSVDGFFAWVITRIERTPFVTEFEVTTPDSKRRKIVTADRLKLNAKVAL